jgi:putative flippase GtrA
VTSYKRQFFKFLVVGFIATAIHFVVMIFLVQVFSVRPVSASTAGYASGALVNYHLNRKFTFSSSVPHSLAMSRFLLVSGVGLLINSLAMYLLAHSLQFNYVASQVAATIIVLMWNFTLSKLWTFSVRG